MPLYITYCSKCRETKEVLTSYTDMYAPCEVCGSLTERQFPLTARPKWNCQCPTGSEGLPTQNGNYKIGKHKNKIMEEKEVMVKSLKEGKKDGNRKPKISKKI